MIFVIINFFRKKEMLIINTKTKYNLMQLSIKEQRLHFDFIAFHECSVFAWCSQRV